MFHPGVRDLVKPQWLEVLALLKKSGGLSIPSICRETNHSYMTAKAQCEELAKRGVLVRTRLPRTQTGRPEIQYSLSSQANHLFAEPDLSLSLALLAEARNLYGDIAPERLLHQWFQRFADEWQPILGKCKTRISRLEKLAELRNRNGWFSEVERDPDGLIDHHHPLHPILGIYPKAKVIEHRMLENLLGEKLQRKETTTGRASPPKISHTFG